MIIFSFSSWKFFFGLVKMTFGLVDVGYGLPEGQAVKSIFFAPWPYPILNQNGQSLITAHIEVTSIFVHPKMC